MHAADMINKYRAGPDGRTAYEKIKGRAYSGTVFEFGTCILYKVDSKVLGGDMSARWEPGIWLGKRFASEEHIVGREDGSVVRSGAVKLHLERVRFRPFRQVAWISLGS